jgi:hypothetical protein
MKKHRIKVWDHKNSRTAPPGKFEVDAWCVGGATGIIAYFVQDGTLYEAHGDDGHWWLVGEMHYHWLEKIQEVVAAVEISKQDRAKFKRTDRKKR